MGRQGPSDKMELSGQDYLNLSKQLDGTFVVRQNNSRETNINIEGVKEKWEK
jgi:hypothetical protein